MEPLRVPPEQQTTVSFSVLDADKFQGATETFKYLQGFMKSDH